MTAIEAYGIKQEQQEDGTYTWPYFSFLKEPRWRVNHFLKLSTEDKLEIKTAIYDIIYCLPVEIVEKIESVKIVGSYAAGTAELSSDIDFAIWLNSEETHEYYRQMMSNKDNVHLFKSFFQSQTKYSCFTGIKIEGAISGFFTSPEIPTYDIDTGILNGLVNDNSFLKFTRPDGAVVAGKTAFNRETKEYYIIERKRKVNNLEDRYYD